MGVELSKSSLDGGSACATPVSSTPRTAVTAPIAAIRAHADARHRKDSVV